MSKRTTKSSKKSEVESTSPAIEPGNGSTNAALPADIASPNDASTDASSAASPNEAKSVTAPEAAEKPKRKRAATTSTRRKKATDEAAAGEAAAATPEAAADTEASGKSASKKKSAETKAAPAKRTTRKSKTAATAESASEIPEATAAPAIEAATTPVEAPAEIPAVTPTETPAASSTEPVVSESAAGKETRVRGGQNRASSRGKRTKSDAKTTSAAPAETAPVAPPQETSAPIAETPAPVQEMPPVETPAATAPEKPAPQQAVSQQAMSEQPASEQSATEQPPTEKSATEKSTTEKAAPERQPASEKPASPRPAQENNRTQNQSGRGEQQSRRESRDNRNNRDARNRQGQTQKSSSGQASQPQSQQNQSQQNQSQQNQSQQNQSQGKQHTSQPQASQSQASQQQSAPAPQKPQGRRWYKVDLHMHTMASNDYEDPQLSWLDWLKVVAERGLEIVAIADHNTVRGIAQIRSEIEWLTKLEAANRLNEQERADLTAWRDLSNRVLVLPGFEFTATFGFHILGIFPPETSVRTLEQLLLKLNVPQEKLDIGSTETGASADVLTAYRVIHEAGGLAIAAHANSTHGVALRDFPFGGQTKIAYTQDPHLDALEVTDLEGHRYSTARFFNGSKPEYPRRMHCIQGSDSHRINTDPRNPKRLGIGERATEMLLDEPSFAAIRDLLRSTHFDRTRPARPKDKPFDAFANAREEGNSIVQSFHEGIRNGKLDTILNDVCAFANTAGGSIYVGASARKDRPSGIQRPRQVEEQVRSALAERLTPQLDLNIDVVQSEGANILRIRVPKGIDRPYALDGQKFYVRDESETSLAVRDEIIAMVLETIQQRDVEIAPGIESLTLSTGSPEREDAPAESHRSSRGRSRNERKSTRSHGAGNGENGESGSRASRPTAEVEVATSGDPDDAFYLPQMGVEIVESETRNGGQYHTIRDLRTGNMVRNISRKSAKDLWSYAIRQLETGAVKSSAIKWQGNRGLVHVERRAGKMRYDLALREGSKTRIFFGVTEDGMEGPWAQFVQEEQTV